LTSKKATGLMLEFLSSFSIALAISVLLHLALKKPAVWLGLVDIPQGRKSHRGMTPLIGGLAMFGAYALSLAASGLLLGDLGLVLVGAALLVCCGLLDDFFFLPPVCKLLAQIGAALIIVLGTGVAIDDLGIGWSLPEEVRAPAAVLLTLVFLVGGMNAFNMLDGADGLAGGIALIAAGWLALAAALSGHAAEAVALALLAAVILGFLAFNARCAGRRQASVFMGDAGSLLLGGLLAAFAVRLCRGGADGVPFVVLLWVFALPAIDAGSVILRRIAAGRSPLRSDSGHLHHFCRREGWTVERTVGGVWLVSGLTGGIGVVGWWGGASEALLWAGLGVPALAHLWFVRRCLTGPAAFRSWRGAWRLPRKAEIREA
jgi:UDP-GlcNAc:undecaprenyl-phosphate GlcNAc-1-phosphate transferase